jgi:predicted aminopeptidase
VDSVDLEATFADEVEMSAVRDWLEKYGLLDAQLSDAQLRKRYARFANCTFDLVE